ncbi:MAG: 1,4-dihydroxy-2-naphthoate octaprenyltransferase [Crocinitomicaceae bacterium]
MLKHWISAFRLRTLPLALSTILMGNAMAVKNENFSFSIFTLSIIVTMLLQILSNLANDYGDGIKGTDNNNRIGPTRALQSGAISQKQMMIAIIIFSILALISGIWLVFSALSNPYSVLLFILLGLGAIAAAIKYTVGKKAYGYSGLGDFFVFIFFGIVGVNGSFYLQTGFIEILYFLPAISIGCFSTAVLNLNNMRDIENDRASSKNTLAVKMGLATAKKYHYSLFFWSYIALFLFLYFESYNLPKTYLIVSTLAALAIHIKHLITVNKSSDYKSFDPQLKVIALSSFLLSLAWFLTISLI